MRHRFEKRIFPMRSSMFILPLTIVTLMTVACGAASGSDPTEAGLQSRAESQAKAQSDGDWAGWYNFLSAGNKSACSVVDFAAGADMSMSSFKGSKGLAESDGLEFRVQEVTVQGTQGLVIGDIYFDGELLLDSPNENWIFVDDDWWSVISIAECRLPSPTPMPTPPGASEIADTPAPVTGAFGGADMRVLLSDEEVAAALPLVIGRMPPITDMRGLAGDEGMVGRDSIWGHLFPSAAGGQLMVIVTDFASPEILQQQIVVWTVRDSLKFTKPIIGDGSLQGQEGDTVSVRVWKGDKAVLLRTTDLPGTQEVLDGLIALAKLAVSRLSSD